MSSFRSAAYYIDRFRMTTHVEGGSFAEVYRSSLSIPVSAVPGFHGDRPTATQIYFLLQAGQFSAFHRIASDELWHFYDGDPLIVYEICQTGELLEHRLGLGQTPCFFTVIRAGSWFASRSEGVFSLVGCTVAPGFDFAEFELAKADELARLYPAHEALIRELCGC